MREARFVARAITSTKHPILAHLIPMRRCNLLADTATNTTKFQRRSPWSRSKRRIDRLAEFGTSAITLSGGEPMLHPDIDAIISHIRSTGR
jgi:MoaA/NifB/PqqE/SkfB family radical SAM enzyme